MHKRTAHRARLLTIIMVGIFLAFGSFWLVQVMENGDSGLAADAFKNEPDYIVENFSIVRMTADGKPRYLISGAKLTHRPHDDSADIELPVVRGVSPGEPLLTIDAHRARIDHGNTQVHLMGDVDIERKALGELQAMTLKTEALTIFPDEDRMQSDTEVLMKRGNATLSGTGMRADNATKQIHMRSRGQIVYPPRTAR